MRVLQAVVETGSVKAASEKLYKTQPAISLAIKALETQTGAELFDRSGYRLVLTPIGKRIYTQSLRVISEVNDLKLLARHYGLGNEEKITISKDELFDISALVPCLQVIQSEFPETRISFCSEILSGTAEVVENGTADIGIAPLPITFMEEKELEYLPLTKIELVNVASPKFLRPDLNIKDIRKLRSFHQILVSDSGSQKGEFDRDMGVQKGQRVWYVEDIHLKKELLLAGLGWGRLPRHLIEHEMAEGTLKEISFEFTRAPFKLDVFAFRSSSLSLGPVASRLWRELRKVTF
ncbi:LysR family transcriptional regulator [Vibrio sp. VB16]|uniref:LysR family transcriptional regulator n=1 Tax=Vibrio sp. VB16 TaxID=2785746 RepID=UPI00189DA1AB|nr:LysR family transcriptional regulator [Vibrio sp. VB16]UGA53572.1 LysR family transcriptional regulator [Vibrio sp. VB16]